MTKLEEQYEIPLKILIIGDTDAGKTSLWRAYKQDKREVSPTKGVEYVIACNQVNHQRLKLGLWDFAGDATHKHRTIFYENVHLIMFVFDLTKHSSFKRIAEILEEDKESLPQSPMILVGTKADLEDEREVDSEAATHFAKEHKLTYIETSAKDEKSINLLFEQASLRGYSHYLKSQARVENSEVVEEDESIYSVEEDPTNSSLINLRNYVDILSTLDEKAYSKNALKAGKAKAKYLLANLLKDNEAPTKDEVKELLKNNYGHVLDNRSRFGIKLYKIRSFFFGCRNQFQHGRLCESKTEELLVKYYNSLT